MRNDNLKFNDIFWNTLGTITYSMVSLLISVVIIKMCGSIEGGIFSFGFSTLAHLVFIISFFGIRPMHIVDIKYRFSFNDYKNFGIKTFFVSIILGSIYILYMLNIGAYNNTKTLLLFILIIHGALDGFADYFECEFQRVNKLYMSGQSIFFRILGYTITLITMLLITNNLLFSEICAIVVEIVFFYFFNIIRGKKVFKNAKQDEKISKGKILFIDALPLFLITFLDMLIFSSAKMSIDANLGDVYSGFFSMVFMPTNGIYLVMTLIMKPLLTPLSNAYYNDKKEYQNILFHTILISIFISIFFMLIAVFLGRIYLNLVNIVTGNVYEWTKNIIIYKGLSLDYIIFLIVMCGGIFYTISTPVYYTIILENKQSYLVISYIIVAIISIYLSRVFTINEGIIGAAISFLISMFLLFAGIVIVKVITNYVR